MFSSLYGILRNLPPFLALLCRSKKLGDFFQILVDHWVLRISALYNELVKGNAAMIRQSFKNKWKIMILISNFYYFQRWWRCGSKISRTLRWLRNLHVQRSGYFTKVSGGDWRSYDPNHAFWKTHPFYHWASTNGPETCRGRGKAPWRRLWRHRLQCRVIY